MTKITPKQAQFVQEYLIDLNLTQAAIRAGYSKNGADTAGHRLLENPEIVAAINAGKADRSEKTAINADWVLFRLAEEATADIADLYDEATGDLLPVSEWPLIWRQGLVTGLEINALFEGGGEDRKQIGFVKKIKFSDRVRRLELIGRHVSVKAFEDHITFQGLEGLADRLARARQRNVERDDAQENATAVVAVTAKSSNGPAGSSSPPAAVPPIPAAVEQKPAPAAPAPPPEPYTPITRPIGVIGVPHPHYGGSAPWPDNHRRIRWPGRGVPEFQPAAARQPLRDAQRDRCHGRADVRHVERCDEPGRDGNRQCKGCVHWECSRHYAGRCWYYAPADAVCLFAVLALADRRDSGPEVEGCNEMIVIDLP